MTTQPRIPILPNVLRNGVAPNTLGGMAATPASPRRITPRQLWRIVLYVGLGLMLALALVMARPW
jgi:hypothetical protein